MKTMKPSTLAMHMALFGYPAGGSAFVNYKNPPVRKRPRHHRHRHLERPREPRTKAVVDLTASPPDSIEMLPMASPEAPVRRRHPVFQETNAVSKRMPVPHPELWRRCLPGFEEQEKDKGGDDFWGFLSPQKKQVHFGEVTLNDNHVQFDDPAVGARQLLEQCGVIGASADTDEPSSSLPLPETSMAENETTQHLTDVLAHFQTVAAPANGPGNVECIARVVSTVGPMGTKCPRWHADHVPVRMVMSILGPGCEYIPETFHDGNGSQPGIVNRGALNNLDEDDTAVANDIIVPPFGLNGGSSIKHAEAGEAVLLMGRAWEDEKADAKTSDQVLAAVHRSPPLSPNQERILLTVDLVDWN